MNAIATPADADAARPKATTARELRILSLCCLYPNPLEPHQGVFVERRLQHLAEVADVQVIAPVAVVQYGKPKGKRLYFGEDACPRRRQGGAVPVWHPRWFYPPFSSGLIPFWLALGLAYRLARLHREFAFEIIDTHFGFPEGIAGAAVSLFLRVPFTMTLRGNEPKHSRGRLDRLAMSWALRRAARVFAVSERLRRFAIELGADPAKVKTVPNGVDTAIFRPRDRRECRLRHGLPLDTPLILSAGGLVERKGHHRVMEALNRLREEGSPAQLLIAGGPGPEGQYEDKLRELASALGLHAAVHFLGPLPAHELAEVMCAADLLCLASTNEGWPNVVHEALACGTPVVATDVGAIPEMLAQESYGIVVPANDAEMLRQALARAFQTDWDRAAIANWGGSRSWSNVATEVLGEIQAILRT
jgi:glycosyltransferase involved in cell wall biosynthesis